MAAPADAVQRQKDAASPDIQKAQGYLRTLGITTVEVNGQKTDLAVDGRNGPVTSAALAQYRAENGFNNNDSFDTVLRHMEDRIKQNPPGIQQFMSGTMADGQQANPFNVMAMQLVTNLLAPLVKTLSGGKIDLESLKVDGINGPRTSNAYNGYNAVMNNDTFKPHDPSLPQAGPDGDDPIGAFIAQRGLDGPPPDIGRITSRYNNTSGVDTRNQMLQQQAELRETGYSPRDAQAIVRNERAGELENDGLDRRAALRQSRIETREADRYEREQMRAESAQNRNIDRAITRTSRDLGRATDSMIGGNPQRARQILTRTGVETAVGSIIGQGDRDSARVSRQFGNAAGILTDGNPGNDRRATQILTRVGIGAMIQGARDPINALMSAIGGGNSRTYAAEPPPRGSYTGYQRGNAGQEWDNNQIRPEFGGASSYAGANDPRMALRAQQPMDTEPLRYDEARTGQPRMQDMFSLR